MKYSSEIAGLLLDAANGGAPTKTKSTTGNKFLSVTSTTNEQEYGRKERMLTAIMSSKAQEWAK